MGREDLIGNSPNQLVPPEGRNERGPKWMKDANQGQKAFTRFSGNQFDDRKGATKSKGAMKGGVNAGAESKPAGKGGKPALNASKPNVPKPNVPKPNVPKSNRPGAKAPFGQSSAKASGAQSKGGGKPSHNRQQAK